MLESFAAWILNTYIGDYFGNVNTDQLRMSLKSGEIELERLPLKRDLIKHLGLPLQANTGYIGKISIKFPRWHSFTSEPLVITVENLFLIVKPINNFTYNEEEETKAQQEFKISQLDTMESRWKALHDDLTEQSSYYSSSYSSWLNYGSSFVNNVLLNIHLKISSVHIRYEDNTTIAGCPFATGIVIRSLTICSTDVNWEPKFVTRDNQSDRNLLFKLIDMESFSCYCDTDTTLFSNQSFDLMVDLMKQSLEKNLNRKGNFVEHGYIIAPVNGKCYLKRNCSELSLKSCKQPRTVIDVQLEKVPIMMTAIQYKHLLDWSLAFNTSKTLWRYRKWRPMIHKKNQRKKIKSSESDSEEEEEDEEQFTGQGVNGCRFGFEPKIWWHFAVDANLEEYRQRRQRFNWHFILRRSRDIVSYHRAYLHYLIYPELFTKEMRYDKDRVESEFTLDEICSIREIVFNQGARILKQQQNQQRSPSVSGQGSSQLTAIEEPDEKQQQSSYWFSPSILSNLYFSYSMSSSSAESTAETTPVADVKIEIEDEETDDKSSHKRTYSTSSTTEDVFLTRDAVFCQFNFQIHNSSFQLIAFDSETLNTTIHDQTFVSAISNCSTIQRDSSGNLLLEFEFTQMKIAIDITNPNAYSCICHMNQGYKRRQQSVQQSQQVNQQFLTQNELNMLQLNLNFEWHNLNLTLLRTEHDIISDDDTQKLVSAQLTGCGITILVSNYFIAIDGKLDSLEVWDRVTQPSVNKHKRVLSVGRKQIDPDKTTEHSEQKILEKALSFSLSRQLSENMLRFNIEMASFCYVHSALLVYELSLCRKCFSDVLEAYFSRSFKEKVKAATTEMLRGIVNRATDVSTETTADGSINISATTSGISSDKDASQQSVNSSKTSKVLLFGNKQARRKVARKSHSPFIDNFKLNVFIRSPIVIFPISPCSYEVVVFHLGHMSLNNHNHSTDIISPMPPKRSVSKKISPQSPLTHHYFDTYNAEIRDLSVYSLNCQKNIQKYQSTCDDQNKLIPIEELYYCDAFGIPILQKTVIEIVMEKKILLSSMVDLNAGKKTSQSNLDCHLDGLNIISAVNTIDPLMAPKKFSIRSHFCPENLPVGSGSNSADPLHGKPELVLSVEISSIDVRFSYTDLLIFWHILNTLSPNSQAHLAEDETDIPRPINECYQVKSNSNEDLTLSALLASIQEPDGDPDEFRLRLNKLVDLGFDSRDCLRALSATSGDVIEAAFLLSSQSQNLPAQSEQAVDALSDHVINSSDDNQSTATSTDQQQVSSVNSDSRSTKGNGSGRKAKKDVNSNSNLFMSLLSVIEIRILNGSIRIIDDCNQLDIPLLELGVREFRLIQHYTSSTIEAHAQTNFYCDYYNSHLSGWEPFVEHCQVAFSWKIHEPRCHLKSMIPPNFLNNRFQVARRKLAIKIEIKKMFNINISRTLLDLADKVRVTWMQEIVTFMNMPPAKRSFRQRQPFIPFALKNDTGSNIQLFASNKMFSTGKAADLVTHCDLQPSLEVGVDQLVYFDLVDAPQINGTVNQFQQHHHRWLRNSNSASTPLKILVKVHGWRVTFPLYIEREGTFIRHIISERYFKHSAILVFEISLQASAIKLITVRSSLLIHNRTTKTVELKFANTAMTYGKTSYLINPNSTFPVPLVLLYARIQLRPWDLGIGTCSSAINWNHVRRYGETHCSLQICTPITHTSQASYSKSIAYVVTVLVERNAIGALVESRNFSDDVSENHLPPAYGQTPQLTLPSHTITLLPPLLIANRLPYELRFSILNTNSTGTIRSGDDFSIHYISPLEPFNIEFKMEHFPNSKPLTIQPGAIKNYTSYIDMYDSKGRLLVLHAQVAIVSGNQQPCNAMTITVYAPYWIVNRSGLPLIFSQEDCQVEAAGQSEEHERARSISPLLFSFADNEAPNCCIMRLGRMMPNTEPRWCNFFYLERGAFFRRLRVGEHQPENHLFTEKIYEFGIDIRNGRDRYSNTKIVTIAPRFQIENLTSYKLEFAQKCLVDQMTSPALNSQPPSLNENSFIPSYMSSPVKFRSASITNTDYEENIISALPKSNMPYHWPCTNKPKLLCVRIATIIDCMWSGSFDVGNDPSVSFHLNIRDESSRSYFIRVEILLQNATYFIVFTDANSLPPPLRVENFSQVSIEFFQMGSSQRTVVRANSSVPYALDEPTKPGHITVCAPGGSTATYDLNSFAPGDNLTYDNFYYIAFEETFTTTAGNFTANYIADLEEEDQIMLMMLAKSDFASYESSGSLMLVLDVPDDISEYGTTTPVVLERKERGKRSQLWRIDVKNRIIHEGSSPPLEPGLQDFGFADVKFGNNISESTLMVLDVDDDGLDRTNISLVIRKMNPRRYATQTWRFTEDGRLQCLKYDNLFVQQQVNSTSTFHSGAKAVLAPGPLDSEPPKEQRISKQKMRKGSGVLNISIVADGPSRVLRIKDNQLSANGRHLNLVHSYSNLMTGAMLPSHEESNSFIVNLLRQTELELNLHIDSIGISVISKANEEIVYLFLQRIILETLCNPVECRLNCVVQNFQVDNQLRTYERDVLLYVTNLDPVINMLEPGPSGLSTSMDSSQSSNSDNPAITFNMHKLFITNVETNVFKSLQVTINDLVLNLEELVLLKLLEFINYDPVDNEMDEISSSGNADLLYHANRNVSSSLSRSVQYYFAYLLVQLSRVKLSVFTSAQKLSSYLNELKKKAGIKLIRFEEALIQLRPFHKVYSLMTRRFLQDSIKEHYRSELRSQAAKILGTVDFLGNPVGFLNNVAEGFNELINEGSLRGLIMNVTHGISDSTAKVTSVLSESLGSVTMDARYLEIRRKIKQQSSLGGQRSHLSAGALGLAHGIFGGITSVITQTYDGVMNQGGVSGLLFGLGKGLLGTFTKPAVGMLDFASGAATAVRDSSRKAWNASGSPVNRVRLPRTLTIDGRLTTYDPVQATWQTRFYSTSDFGSREHGEQFVHVFMLSDRHFMMLTSERLYFFHTTLARRDMPSRHQHQYPSQEQSKRTTIGNCSIMQLQIFSLEHLAECVHYQMRSFDALRFLRNCGGECLDISHLKPGDEEQFCYFTEFHPGQQQQFGTRPTSGSTVTTIHCPKFLSLCYLYCDNRDTILQLVQLTNEAKHLLEERKFNVTPLTNT